MLVDASQLGGHVCVGEGDLALLLGGAGGLAGGWQWMEQEVNQTIVVEVFELM